MGMTARTDFFNFLINIILKYIGACLELDVRRVNQLKRQKDAFRKAAVASFLRTQTVRVRNFTLHNLTTRRLRSFCVSRSSLGLKSILKMPGLEPRTSRLSMQSECAYHLRYILMYVNCFRI